MQVLGYIREHPDCSNREACKAVGLRREDFFLTRESEKKYDDDYREARGYGDEQLVNTFRKLAVEGVERPIVSAGKLVRDDQGNILYERVYSDRLVELGLKMHTAAGKALVANKRGIEITGGVTHQHEIQAGVSFAEVAKVLRAAGKLELEDGGSTSHVLGDGTSPEAPEGTAEIVAEEDA